MNTKSSLPRPRWYAAGVVGAVVAIAALGAAALLIDDDLTDSILGFFVGMIGMVLIMVILWTELVRKMMARKRDSAALDDLEPLRAASDADSSDQRTDKR